MTTNQKPQPLFSVPERKLCPVCGEVSYSPAGVHPQCSVQQADEQRMQKARRRAKSRKKAVVAPTRKTWHKDCPRCRASVHCRKATCDCGHRFVTAPPTRR